MVEVAALLIACVALLVGVTNLAMIGHRYWEERKNPPPGTDQYDRTVRALGDPDDLNEGFDWTPFNDTKEGAKE